MVVRWSAGADTSSRELLAHATDEEPVVLVVVVGIQATIVVVQVVLIGCIVGRSGPPVRVRRSILERTIVVVPGVEYAMGIARRYRQPK